MVDKKTVTELMDRYEMMGSRVLSCQVSVAYLNHILESILGTRWTEAEATALLSWFNQEDLVYPKRCHANVSQWCRTTCMVFRPAYVVHAEAARYKFTLSPWVCGLYWTHCQQAESRLLGYSGE